MNRNKILLILMIAVLFISCQSQKKATTTKSEMPAEIEVDDLEQLESTALLIDGSKQKILGNTSNAMLLFSQAIRANPNNAAAHFELSKIYAQQKQLNDAEKHARIASNLEPENKYYKLTLADIYFLRERNQEGIAIQEELALTNPNKMDLQLALLSSYLYIEEYEKALRQIDYIESISGFSNELALQKQQLYIELGQFDKAIEETEKLLSFYPNDLLYLETLGEIHEKAGNTEKAYQIYQKMIELNPDYAMARLLLADYYKTKGEDEKSFEQVKIAFDSDNLGIQAKIRILLTYFFMGEEEIVHREQANVLLQMLLEDYPENHRVMAIYADFLLNEDKPEEAKKYFQKAVELEPGEFIYWQQLLFITAQKEDYISMLEISNEVLTYFLEQPLAYYFNGVANYQLKNYEAAINALNYGKDLTVSDPEMYNQFITLLGDTHFKNKDREMAFQYYREVLSREPDNAFALNNYSYYLSLTGQNLEKAYDMSKKAVELQPENAAFLDTYGWINYQLGEYERAHEFIKKSVELSEEPSAVVLEHYGDVLYKLGEKEEAHQYWKEAQQLAGDEDDEVSEFLNEKVLQKKLIE